MNKKIYLLLTLLLTMVLRVEASHLFGGDITWTCLGNGQYEFQLRAYRDCGSGVSFPAWNQIEVYGHPSVCSIPFNLGLTQVNDLSPSNCGFTCAQQNPNSVEEIIYRTNPVTLAGVPPATGWVFAVNGFARPNLANLGGGGQGFTLRSIMFPYAGLNANPCFDSSPYFAEKPNTYICIGYPFTYNPTAVDPDRDSLVYSWAQPLDEPTSNSCTPFAAPVLPFSPAPYTINNQLPGNVTLDSQSGEISFFVPQSPAIIGNFATCIKVTAYRCGIKIAEVYRDYGVKLITNCLVQGTPPNNINLPPTLTKPFANATSYDTIVYVGDTVRFQISGTDFQRNLGAGVVGQTITLTASGDQLGVPNNTDGGCGNPPCAKLSKLLPSTAPFANFVNFEWVTSCNHVVPPVGCLSVNDTYYFIIKALDNYCPAPGISTATIKIQVKIPPKLKAPQVRGASVFNGNGDVGLYWERPVSPQALDTHNVFHSYEIYAATNNAGPYTLIDSVTGSKNFYKQKGDTLTAAQLSLIGANALNAPVYFYVRTRSVCDGDSISSPSDTIRTMKLTHSIVNCETKLSWNSLFTKAYPYTADTLYTIYREHPIGSIPAPIATVSYTWPTATYTDPFSKNVCRDSVKYYVVIGDTCNLNMYPTPYKKCISYSTRDSVTTDNRFTANIAPTGPTDVCPGNCVAMSASPSPLSPCFTYSYAWSNGGNTQNINACNAGGYSAVITASPSGCTATTPASVVNLKPVPTATMSVVGPSTVCPGDSVSVRITFTGTGPWTYSYNAPGAGCVGSQVINGPAGGTMTNPLTLRFPPACTFNYTMNSVFAGCSGNVSGNANITVRTKPTAVMSLTANDTICTGGASNIQITFTGTAPWDYTYTNTSGVPVSGTTSSNPLNIVVAPTVTSTYGLSYVKDACIGTILAGTRKVVVVPTPSATLSVLNGNDTLCVGSGTSVKIDFTGTAPFVGNLKDNSTGLLTAVNTASLSLNIPVSPLVTTTYTFQNFTSSTKLCTGPVGAGVTVVVKPLPTANIAATTSTTICRGDSVRMQVSFTGSSPYNFGLVTNSGAAVNTAAGVANPYSFYVKPTANANYIVTTVTDGFCTRSGVNDTVKVTVNQLPTAVLSGTNSICAGQATNLTINFTGNGPFSGSYTATPGGTTNFNGVATPYIIPVNPTATTVYSLGTTVSDVNCSNTSGAATATVTVNQLPAANISGNKTVCQGSGDTLLINFTAGAAPWKFYYKNSLGNTFGPVTTSSNPYNLIVAPGSTATYTLDSVFSGTCKGSVAGSGTIAVQALPTAVITTSNDTICNGGNTSLSINFTGAAPFSYQLAGQALQNAATNPVTIPVAPTSSTTYTLQVIKDNLCRSNVSQPVSVKVIQLPTAAITTATPNLCNGMAGSITVNFTGSGPFSTSYSNGGSSIAVNSNTSSIVIPVNPTAPTTYNLVGNVTGLFGCSAPVNPATATITVRPLPTVNLAGSPVICAGDTANITFSFTGNPPYNYTYFNGTSNVALTTSTTPVQVPVHPGSTTLYTPISVSDAYCTGTSVTGSAQVSVNPIPTVNLKGSDTICFGGSSVLEFYFTGTPPFDYTYTANGAGAGALSASDDTVSITVSPSLSTRYTMGLVLQDRFCTNNNVTDSVYLKVTPTPTAAVSGTTAICAGNNTNLQISFTGEAPFTYSYNAGSTTVGPLSTNSNSININVAPASTTNYTLISPVIGNACNGTISGNALVTVNPLPTAVITTATDTLCKGDSTTLQISFTGTGPYQYQLQGQAQQNATSNPYSFYVVPASGLVNYTLANVEDANCTATINQAVGVRVIPNPTVNITTSTPDICNGVAGNLNFAFTGAGPFAATYSNGAGSVPVTSTTNSASVVVNPTVTTSYFMTGNVTGLYGCKTTIRDTALITVRPLPTAAISGTPVICLNQLAPITLNFTGTAPFNYTYLNSVTNQSISGTTSLNPLTLNVSPSSSTGYTVTAVRDNYCVGSQLNGAAQVTVNPLPVPVITGDDQICNGETSVLTTTVNYSGYVWSNTQTSSSIGATTAGNYSVLVTDANGCKKTSPAFNLTVNNVPVADFTNDTSKTCEIPRINFTNLSTYDAGSTFAWNLGENTTSAEMNPSHVYTQPGNFPIQLIVTTPAGCTDTVDRNVDIQFYPLPVAAFKADPSTTNVFSGPITFTDQSQNAVKWHWQFGDLDSSSEQNMMFTFPDIGDYIVKLTVENISGCVSETEQQIVVNPFYLPSGFTPNGDGKNEVFFNPGFSMDYTGFNLRIFNKWGQMFYQTNTYTNPWDGLDAKGQPAPQGVYVYSLSITNKSGKEHQYNGTITLLR